MKRIIITLCIFATAMGFMEAAIVIYLRQLYYPGGFEFPLRPMPMNTARVELFREAAAIIMLIAAGYLAGKSALQRFAGFILAFAVWDLFYYVFLYIFLQWPPSLGTWDILFLLPIPWVGPVWAPLLLCVLMITGSIHILYRTEIDPRTCVSTWEWWMAISGAVIAIFSFMLDFAGTLLSKKNIMDEHHLFSEVHHYVPGAFQYHIFLTGFALMCWPVVRRIIKSQQSS